MNKYINYASFDFDAIDFDTIVETLENVIDNKIGVTFPLRISFSGRNFSIKNRDELIVFINTVRCTSDRIYEEVDQYQRYNDCYDMELNCSDEIKYDSYDLAYKNYGPINEDLFFLNNSK